MIGSADFAFDLQFGAVALRYVLHNREAEPGAASLSGSRTIHAIEAFGESRQVLCGDACAGVANLNENAGIVGPRAGNR